MMLSEVYANREGNTDSREDVRLLAEVGKKIIAELDIERVIEVIFENLSLLMDVAVFDIGLYNERTQCLEFPGGIEEGERLPFHTYSIQTDRHRLAVHCFLNQQEIYINDFHKQYNQYIPDAPVPQPILGKKSNSIIYLPLVSKNEVIGTITVQSFRLNAYTPYHMGLLRNLAVYIAIALENASNYEEIEQQKELIEKQNLILSEQKNAIEQAYQNIQLLGEMGQNITSSLDSETIVERIHANLNHLMDATIFWIGIYDENRSCLKFVGGKERDEVLPYFELPLTEIDRLAVHCFINKAEIHINDHENEYHKYVRVYKPPIMGEMPQSIIYLPLLVKEKAIGVITVQAFQKNAYTTNHVNILRNLGVYAAIALENATAYKEIESQKELIEQAYQNIQLLGQLGQQITSSLDIETVTERIHESLNTLMDASVFWIGIYNPQKHVLEFVGGKERGQTLPYFELDMADENRLAAYCFNNKSEVWLNDYPNDYHRYIKTFSGAILGDIPLSIIYMPLMAKEECIGAVTVQSFQKNAYTQNHVYLLRSLAAYISIAVENARLYREMEDKVKERTAEVVRQKEELEESNAQIEKAYQNVKLLGEIGLQITTELSTDKIIEKVYERVNSLMDAAAFAIGILTESRARIEFRGAMEKGQKLPNFYHSMNDDKRFSVWAIKNRKEVLINDYSKEYNKYVKEIKPPEAGDDPESIIYLPLISKDIVIGVITVQSFRKNAYDEYCLNILRSLAVFAANAIENAEAYRKIEAQNEDIRRTNDKMTASINYARRIQQAMLPDRVAIQKELKDSFILFRPRDIVSGDFYWFLKKEGKIFIAAVDCTGHGVPGAFMSMIGNDFLNEIVSLLNVESPELILDTLHSHVRRALKQAATDNRDGMDIALCVIDQQRQVLEYAGAKNPLIYIRHDQPEVVHHIKGDKVPIGGMQKEKNRRFTKHTIPLKVPTSFYIFTDGMQDQFGGAQGSKYSISRLKRFFADNCQLSMEHQRRELRSELMEWMQNERQIDDILVIGFRLG
ncbi:GAF domain-containing SpoIIE family protein phosphatase [Rhodoflexus sp.]